VRKEETMAYTKLLYHVVFSTKQRRLFLTSEIMARIRDYISGIVRAEKGELIAADGADDHIHLALALGPVSSLADLLRQIKARSSKLLHDTLPDLKSFAWQESYSAFTISPSVLPRVLDYIQGQRQHHKTMSFDEEIQGLLKRHGIEFDPQYL
jgi:putative transposase